MTDEELEAVGNRLRALDGGTLLRIAKQTGVIGTSGPLTADQLRGFMLGLFYEPLKSLTAKERDQYIDGFNRLGIGMARPPGHA